MADLCLKCLRKKSACLCSYIRPIDCGIKIVFLQHQKEAKHQKTGTGRLSYLCLESSELIVGVDFSQNKRVNELLQDTKYLPFVLYPAPNALTAKSPDLPKLLQKKTLLVFVIDGTWFCAKKIMQKSINLQPLPTLSFYGSYKSLFTFKREPRIDFISTIESCYYLIKELQDQHLSKTCDPAPLMTVFKKMVLFQLEAQNTRIITHSKGTHKKDEHYNNIIPIPNYLQAQPAPCRRE